MSALTSAARSHSFSPVIFNSGEVDTDRTYFNLADYIIMFENSYSYFSTGGGNTSLSTIKSMYRSKTIIDIYDFDGDSEVQGISELLNVSFSKS
jgi:hypothetical protein